MLNNKFLLFLMLVFIVSISAVNAHDSDIGVFANQADYGTLKTDDVGNFTELNDEIGKQVEISH